jgi:RNA polymerase sigma factor (sigma-70 family)
MTEVAAPAGFNRLLSDERLTRRAVGGDERAFGAIFRRYHQPLYRFCLAIVGTPEDAQDALQNTMIKVMRALPGEERKIDLKPWLYRIAHNESIDMLRRRRETRQLDVEQAAPGHGLAEDAATRDRLRRLIVDLKELPERQREVLVMREMAGLGFEEIGSALDTSGAVARQTLYEARQSLRQMEEGREMSCDAVTRALSDGDGRVTRRRDVRAHLRSCATCRSFREEIKTRQHDLAALSPLPAVAAAGMLQGLLGGTQAASGGGLAALLGGGAAKTIGISAAAKGVATVAVVAAVGVTAADRTGVIHLGLPGEPGSKSSEAVPGGSGAGAGHHHHGAGVSAGAAVAGKGGGKDAGGTGAVGEAKGDGAAGAAGSMGEHSAAHAPGRGHERPAVESHLDSKGHGPPEGHATGRGHEKELPSAAAGGQEAAEGNKPTLPEPTVPSGKEDGDAVAVPKPKPSHPSPPSSAPEPPKGGAAAPPKGGAAAPPKAAPASPPAAKPEKESAPEPQPKAQPQASEREPGSPPSAGGRSAEKNAAAESPSPASD